MLKKWKYKKQEKRQKTGEKIGKKGKEGPKGYHPRWAQKLIVHKELSRDRNEIEARKKSDFEHPTKKKKMKENERKWKKMKEKWKTSERKWNKNERKWIQIKENERKRTW